jgi:quinol monooxygenase YgiN
MIFITAKFRSRPEDAGWWPEICREFTEATRAEPGCL